jgi:Family of unknown function (DUF5760)
MADPGIGTYVRYWLHYSNLSSSLYKQFGAARKVRDDYEKQVINTLQQNGMEKATIQIGGGSITVTERREPNQLSLTKIEELLHAYFKQKGGADQTLDIMTFLKANRGYTINKSLKQSGMPQPPANANGGQKQLM